MQTRSTGKIIKVLIQEGQQLIALQHDSVYPGGGGQPPDKITVITPAGSFHLEETCWIDQEPYWILTDQRSVPEGPVDIIIDALWRWEISQQHSAQHLFSGLAYQQYGLKSAGFTIFENYAKIELLTEEDPSQNIQNLEKSVLQAIIQDLPIRIYLEPDHLRIVEIEGIDHCGCGGTHVEKTSQIGAFSILHWERKNKISLRITFAAGIRLGSIAQRYTQWEQDLRKKLTGDVDERIDDILEQLHTFSKNEKKWIQQLAPHLVPQNHWLLLLDLPPRMDTLRQLAGILREQGIPALLVANNGQFVLAGKSCESLFQWLKDHGAKGGGQGLISGTMELSLVPKLTDLIESL